MILFNLKCWIPGPCSYKNSGLDPRCATMDKTWASVGLNLLYKIRLDEMSARAVLAAEAMGFGLVTEC